MSGAGDHPPGRAAPLRIVLLGAGLIGARHARVVGASPRAALAAIVDPSPDAATLASALGVPRRADLAAALARDRPDAAIVATPNATHASLAVACLAAGLPCLVEKPLAPDPTGARAIVEAAERHARPVLVGHHRRHHAVIRRAVEAVAGGTLGRPVAAQVTWCLRKPESYFAAGRWREGAGGGPVWVNLIHEIDLLQALLGPIVEVSALLGAPGRARAVEDTGAIAMRHASGALATALLSDAAPSPWHFEGASGENPTIAATRAPGREADGLRVFGTRASLAIPSLALHAHADAEGGWGDPLVSHVLVSHVLAGGRLGSDERGAGPTDEQAKDEKAEDGQAEDGRAEDMRAMGGEAALAAQLDHFVDVARGLASPRPDVLDGLRAVRVCEAIHRSARERRAVRLDAEAAG